jgi:hypothetical protein
MRMPCQVRRCLLENRIAVTADTPTSAEGDEQLKRRNIIEGCKDLLDVIFLTNQQNVFATNGHKLSRN